MTILMLTKKFPYPPRDGETIAVMQMIKGLAAAGIKITALCMNTKKHYSDSRRLPDHINRLAEFHAVPVDTDPNPAKAFLNLFSRVSYHYQRFYSVEFEQRLTTLLRANTFDIVQTEGLYLLLYLKIIRSHSHARVILRAHNLEYEIWERTLTQMPPGWKRAYLHLQTSRLKKFERQIIPLVDGIAAISNSDMKKFEIIAPALPKIAIPVGIDIPDTLPPVQTEPFSVAYLGGMDWLPNQEGVRWFLENCWGTILKQIPQAKFYLAGRNIPEAFYRMSLPNYHITGEVDDAKNFLLSKSVIIVPLLSGSGIRVKIIENMALGKCIISTTIGAEGTGATHGQQILLADTAHDFARTVCEALSNEPLRQHIGKNAYNFARQHFNNALLTQQLIDFYQKIIG